MTVGMAPERRHGLGAESVASGIHVVTQCLRWYVHPEARCGYHSGIAPY
jgi:hypothetical protein